METGEGKLHTPLPPPPPCGRPDAAADAAACTAVCSSTVYLGMVTNSYLVPDSKLPLPCCSNSSRAICAGTGGASAGRLLPGPAAAETLTSSCHFQEHPS